MEGVKSDVHNNDRVFVVNIYSSDAKTQNLILSNRLKDEIIDLLINYNKIDEQIKKPNDKKLNKR